MDTRCGLSCSDCSWKESHGCGGCVDTMGHPFHGECPIAICCQDKGLAHCGECGNLPCQGLYAYSFQDAEHGDSPPGARIMRCRRAAAEAGKYKWQNVLLTSAGWWRDSVGHDVRWNILTRFHQMLEIPAEKARVLFIPVAAIDDGAKMMAGICRNELLGAGILAENIHTYLMDTPMTLDEAMTYDVLYFTGGSTQHLLTRVRETGFEEIIKQMVYANKVYVGVSAGSILAMASIAHTFSEDSRGFCFAHAFLSVHCPKGTTAREDLPLPHIPLADDQALAVRWDGYDIVE